MATDPQKSMYMVKFLFADASFLEESFTADVSVNDAKQKLISIWPAGKDPISSPDDVRMIYAGKVLENTKSFQDYKVPLGSKVNMHLQPRMFVKTENAPPPDKPMEQTRCCTIL